MRSSITRSKTNIPLSARDESPRLPYRAPVCRALEFRGAGRLCDSGDLITDNQGDFFDTDDSGEGTGGNYYGEGGN